MSADICSLGFGSWCGMSFNGHRTLASATVSRKYNGQCWLVVAHMILHVPFVLFLNSLLNSLPLWIIFMLLDVTQFWQLELSWPDGHLVSLPSCTSVVLAILYHRTLCADCCFGNHSQTVQHPGWWALFPINSCLVWLDQRDLVLFHTVRWN